MMIEKIIHENNELKKPTSKLPFPRGLKDMTDQCQT